MSATREMAVSAPKPRTFFESPDLGGERGGLADLGPRERLELEDLLAREGDGFGDEGQQRFVGEGLRQVVVLGGSGERVGAVLDQGAKLGPERVGRREGPGIKGLDELGDEARVDGVGLGEAVLGLGEVAHLAGVDLDGGVRQGDGVALVDQNDRRGQAPKPARDGLFGVGDARGRRGARWERSGWSLETSTPR